MTEISSEEETFLKSISSKHEKKVIEEEKVKASKPKVDRKSKSDELIQVQAISIGREDNVCGFYGVQTIYEGDIFDVIPRHFSSNWMKKI